MDVNSVVSATMRLKNENIASDHQMSMLRLNLDRQTQSMGKLLQALPQPDGSSNPPHLGQKIDFRA